MDTPIICPYSCSSISCFIWVTVCTLPLTRANPTKNCKTVTTSLRSNSNTWSLHQLTGVIIARIQAINQAYQCLSYTRICIIYTQSRTRVSIINQKRPHLYKRDGGFWMYHLLAAHLQSQSFIAYLRTLSTTILLLSVYVNAYAIFID